jgi:hypothetical protein
MGARLALDSRVDPSRTGARRFREAWSSVEGRSVLTSSVVTRAAFLVLGLVWTWAVGRRWRSNLAELRSSPDRSARLAIVLVWLVSAGVLVLTARSVLAIVAALFG